MNEQSILNIGAASTFECHPAVSLFLGMGVKEFEALKNSVKASGYNCENDLEAWRAIDE